MPVTLKTMSMKYRENGNDSWSPAMVQAKAELEPAMEEIAETASEIGIVITGNRPARNVTAGQYVIVRDSTISGISDGLYTANTGLSPNTDVISGNLTGPKSDGGLNDLKNTFKYQTFVSDNYASTSANWEYTGISFTVPSGSVYLVRVECAWTSQKPKGLAISNSNSTMGPVYVFENDGAQETLPMLLISGTYYVWAKRAAASSNNRYSVYGIEFPA